LHLLHHHGLLLVEAVAKALGGGNCLLDAVGYAARFAAREGPAGEVMNASTEAVLRHGAEEGDELAQVERLHPLV